MAIRGDKTGKKFWSKLALDVLAGGVLLMGAASPALAATDKVTSLADDGSAGTLRSVMSAAAPGDTIVFTVTGTITLAQGVLEINKHLFIDGPGSANLAISGANTFTVFQVDSGVAAVISSVTIEDGYNNTSGGGVYNQGTLGLIKTTITNINSGENAPGGGIYSTGTVVLSDSTISNIFTGGNGGGAYNSGTLDVISSTVSGGTGLPGASGGGIYNTGKLKVSNSTVGGGVHDGGCGGAIYNSGSLDLTNSTLTNSASFFGNGGAVCNTSTGTMSALNTTFSDNSVEDNEQGGAIYNRGTAVLLKSTLSGNSATNGGYGGAIENAGAMTISNSTFSGNTTDGGRGGAIDNQGTLTMVNSTLSENSAGEGGAIYNDDGTLTLKSTLLAGQSGGGNCFLSGAGSTTSDGYNLSDDSTCTFLTQTGDQDNSTTAGLSPSGLQSNGGPTQTIALLSTSSAVNAIPVSACTDTKGNKITTDQRGIKRPQGSACDIGAYELVMTK